MKHYAGLDLSMETTPVCVVDAEGRKVGTQCVESTPEAIAGALERYGPIERAVIETGRMTPSIALGLRELGVAIVCIDARQAHQSLKAMKANKTDPHDAAGLAQLSRTGFYKEVHVKSPAAHGVRAVITARGHRCGDCADGSSAQGDQYCLAGVPSAHEHPRRRRADVRRVRRRRR